MGKKKKGNKKVSGVVEGAAAAAQPPKKEVEQVKGRSNEEILADLKRVFGDDLKTSKDGKVLAGQLIENIPQMLGLISEFKRQKDKTEHEKLRDEEAIKKCLKDFDLILEAFFASTVLKKSPDDFAALNKALKIYTAKDTQRKSITIRIKAEDFVGKSVEEAERMGEKLGEEAMAGVVSIDYRFYKPLFKYYRAGRDEDAISDYVLSNTAWKFTDINDVEGMRLLIDYYLQMQEGVRGRASLTDFLGKIMDPTRETLTLLIKSIDSLHEGGSLEMVYLILEHCKENINALDIVGRNALCAAVMQLELSKGMMNSEAVRLIGKLLEMGSDTKISYNGRSINDVVSPECLAAFEYLKLIDDLKKGLNDLLKDNTLLEKDNSSLEEEIAMVKANLVEVKKLLLERESEIERKQVEIDAQQSVLDDARAENTRQKEELEERIANLEAEIDAQKEELEAKARELEHEVARKEEVLKNALKEKREAVKEKKSEAAKHAQTNAELKELKAANAELAAKFESTEKELRELRQAAKSKKPEIDPKELQRVRSALQEAKDALEEERKLRAQAEEGRKAAQDEAKRQEEMKEERKAVAAKAVELREATEGARDAAIEERNAAMSARDAVMQKNAELMSVNADLNRILQELQSEIMELQQVNQMLQRNLGEESARANGYARMIADSHSGPGGSPNHPRGGGNGMGHFGGGR